MRKLALVTPAAGLRACYSAPTLCMGPVWTTMQETSVPRDSMRLTSTVPLQCKGYSGESMGLWFGSAGTAMPHKLCMEASCDAYPVLKSSTKTFFEGQTIMQTSS